MLYASIYKARKATGCKFTVLIHADQLLSDCLLEAHFHTKNEAKAWAAAFGAQPHNY